MNYLNKNLDEILNNAQFSIQSLTKELYLGGKNPYEFEIITALPSLFSSTDKEETTPELFNAKLMHLKHLDKTIWKNHPQKQLTLMINETLGDSRVNMLNASLLAGFFITSNTSTIDTFFSPEAEPNLEKTFYELYNMGLAIIEGKALLNNLYNKVQAQGEDKTKELIVNLSDLYIERIKNASKGIQSFGDFNRYPILTKEYVNYFATKVTEKNYKDYIQAQMKTLKNPKTYSNYTKYNLEVLKENSMSK